MPLELRYSFFPEIFSTYVVGSFLIEFLILSRLNHYNTNRYFLVVSNNAADFLKVNRKIVSHLVKSVIYGAYSLKVMMRTTRLGK